MKTSMVLTALGLMVAFSSGCNFTEKYCERVVDCMGEELAGTVASCVTDSTAAAENAETIGCAAEYDDASTCAYKNGECTEEDAADGSKYNLYSAGSTCDAETEAYVACATAAASE